MKTGLFGALMLGAVGCTSSTTVLVPASAATHIVGVGIAEHTHDFLGSPFYRMEPMAASVAAVDLGVPAEHADSVWETYAGGRKVRHCFRRAQAGHACSEAEVEIGWGKSLRFIVPATTREEIPPESGDESVEGAARRHGIWALVVGSNKVMHCQLEAGVAQCRPVAPVVESAFAKIDAIESVLGAFHSPDEDVLWMSQIGQVYRCTAGAARPEPQCRVARID